MQDSVNANLSNLQSRGRPVSNANPSIQKNHFEQIGAFAALFQLVSYFPNLMDSYRSSKL